MKKVLLISITLILISINIASNAIVTNSAEYSNVKIYVFYEENNKNYEEEKQWLDENTNIRREYINTNENKELYNNTKEALNIKNDKLPITIIGSTYFVGFDEKVQNSIKEAIEAYENTEEYGDIIKKIKDKEDVKDIIQQNEEIYKQPNLSNGFFNIIIIIIAILLVIFIIKKILKMKLKNKKKSKKSRH